MVRFQGMMPSDEVEIRRSFQTERSVIHIEAGRKGWTIIFADSGTMLDNNIDTSDNNFNTALGKAKEIFSDLKVIEDNHCYIDDFELEENSYV